MNLQSQNLYQTAVDIICLGVRTAWTVQRLQRQESRGVLGSLP